MQSVCDQVPTTLPDDLTNVGYYRQCYQRLRANLHRLPDNIEAGEPETSQRHHSPRKLCSTGSAVQLFPPECIFCDKVEIKSSGRKTERAEVFVEEKRKRMGADRIMG